MRAAFRIWTVRQEAGRYVLAATAAATLLLVWPAWHPPSHSTSSRAGASFAEAADATPDSGLHPPDPFPALQRARLLARLGVDRWHTLGQRGRGIKVAVLDTGFRGYRSQLGKALPARVLVRSFRGDSDLEAKDSQHGILCAEVLHALAPEAELLLANWEPERPDQFLNAARWAKEQGARIVSCSVIMPSWSDGEGHGRVHEALAGILGRDLVCFASAGNIAQRHWAGTFHAGAGGWHEWARGRCDNEVTPWGTEPVSVELYWPKGTDYDLVVVDGGGREVGRSEALFGVERSCAVVRVQPLDGQTYQVRTRLARGTGGQFHLTALGGGLRYATSRSSIPFPGDGPEVVAVGAVDGEGRRTAYSSCGPNSSRPKPDLVAVVPFPSYLRARPFSGTSAAAPQAAGLAALVWSRHADWSAQHVREALQQAAIDLGPPGHDYETGYGLINLPK